MSSLKRTILILTILFSLSNLSLSSAEASTKSQRSNQAIAIAYSACTGGMLEGSTGTYESRVQFSVELATEYHLLLSGQLDDPPPWLNDLAQLSYENLVQGFTLAGSLNPRWRELSSTYRQIEKQVVRNWNSGATLGQSIKRAFASGGQSIVALCVIARSEALSRAKKSSMTTKTWVTRTGGDLLPRLHPAAK